MTKVKQWYPVRVYFPAMYLDTCMEIPADVHEDAIKGTSPLDALKNAMWNWTAAEWIELI